MFGAKLPSPELKTTSTQYTVPPDSARGAVEWGDVRSRSLCRVRGKSAEQVTSPSGTNLLGRQPKAGAKPFRRHTARQVAFFAGPKGHRLSRQSKPTRVPGIAGTHV